MRIVTCDDSKITALELKSRLRELGHEVVAHGFNGEEGIVLCMEHKPDLAIFDVLMPRMTGDKAAEYVAKEKLATHIALATSQGQQGVRDLAERMGFRLIIKPYSPGQLKQILEGL